MLSLQRQAVLLARGQQALLGVTVLATAAFYFLGYRPSTAQLAKLQAITVAHQQELLSNQSKASRRNEIAAKNEKLRQELDLIKKPSKAEEYPDLIKQLTLFGAQNSLKRMDYRPGAQSSSELFTEQPISLTFEGDGVSVFNFLRATEDMPRLTRIRSVSLKTKDNHAGTVQAQVVANIYFSTE